jgi:hypothetical protein
MQRSGVRSQQRTLLLRGGVKKYFGSWRYLPQVDFLVYWPVPALRILHRDQVFCPRVFFKLSFSSASISVLLACRFVRFARGSN